MFNGLLKTVSPQTSCSGGGMLALLAIIKRNHRFGGSPRPSDPAAGQSNSVRQSRSLRPVSRGATKAPRFSTVRMSMAGGTIPALGMGHA